MSNSQEAAAILSELDQFGAGFTELLKTPEGRRDALILHDKLVLMKNEEPNLFTMLSRQEKFIVVSMAYHWLGERMMSAAAQGDAAP